MQWTVRYKITEKGHHVKKNGLAAGIRSNQDMKRLQQDYLSIPARNLVPYLKELKSSDPKTNEAIKMLLAWDFNLDESAVEATIYMAWFRRLRDNVWALLVSESDRNKLPRRPTKLLMDFLARPDAKFGANP